MSVVIFFTSEVFFFTLSSVLKPRIAHELFVECEHSGSTVDMWGCHDGLYHKSGPVLTKISDLMRNPVLL